MALPLPFPVESTPPRPARPLREVTRTDATIAPARPATRRRTIWLAIHLPDWPLHAALSALSADARTRLNAQPLVIVDDDRRGTIVTCNTVAATLGIRPGHS